MLISQKLEPVLESRMVFISILDIRPALFLWFVMVCTCRVEVKGPQTPPFFHCADAGMLLQ